TVDCAYQRSRQLTLTPPRPRISRRDLYLPRRPKPAAIMKLASWSRPFRPTNLMILWAAAASAVRCAPSLPRRHGPCPLGLPVPAHGTPHDHGLFPTLVPQTRPKSMITWRYSGARATR